MTIALAIEAAITHLPIILFVLAWVVAALRGGGAARYLA